jgi:hypothetical protein
MTGTQRVAGSRHIESQVTSPQLNGGAEESQLMTVKKESRGAPSNSGFEPKRSVPNTNIYTINSAGR